MTIAKFAAPVLSMLAVFAGAVAVADAPLVEDSTVDTMTLCVIGSDDALGTMCTVSVDGDLLGGAYLVPGDNYITVIDTGEEPIVTGDEVLAKFIDDNDSGIN